MDRAPAGSPAGRRPRSPGSTAAQPRITAIGSISSAGDLRNSCSRESGSLAALASSGPMLAIDLTAGWSSRSSVWCHECGRCANRRIRSATSAGLPGRRSHAALLLPLWLAGPRWRIAAISEWPPGRRRSRMRANVDRGEQAPGRPLPRRGLQQGQPGGRGRARGPGLMPRSCPTRASRVLVPVSH